MTYNLYRVTNDFRDYAEELIGSFDETIEGLQQAKNVADEHYDRQSCGNKFYKFQVRNGLKTLFTGGDYHLNLNKEYGETD